MDGLVMELKGLVTQVKLGGPENARKKHAERGKLLPRERVNQLLDSGSPFLELGQLAGHELYGQEHVPAGGLITGIGLIKGYVLFVCGDFFSFNFH